MSAWLRLVRPPNLVTAAADVLAGAAMAGFADAAGLPWLLAASVCLYAGGVVLNDALDADRDAEDRPERPIPSGRISRRAARRAAVVLLLCGVLAALAAGRASAVVAGVLAAAVVAYDGWARTVPSLGAPVMGLCRGLNLLLGMSLVPSLLPMYGFVALVPVLYAWALTLISAGEEARMPRRRLAAPLALLAAALALLSAIPLLPSLNPQAAAPYLILLAAWLLPAVGRAIADPSPRRIRRTVAAGVLGVVLVDAVLAAGFAGPLAGALVASLLPAALVLARSFAVA